MRQAARRTAHPAVLAALHPRTDRQRAHADLLAAGGAACVVTGQQVGLFGGPLYTLYKAASAIVNARALTAQTGVPCVPVFWLQVEDHDFDEIAGAAVPGPDGLVRVRVEGDDGHPERSVVHRRPGPSVGEALDVLAGALDGLTHADAVMDELRATWTAETSMAAAFRTWIERRFADHGLLVLDPTHPALAEAASPVHRRALAETRAIAAALGDRARALEAAGFAVQVHVRDDSPLSFLHPEGPEGPRYRVEPDADGWRLCGTDAVVGRAALDAGPWSTSALLRPILQDSWLPTAAYVGGPGEIAYFAQLPPLYEHFGLAMPLVVPRARFEVVDAGSRRLLDQLGLDRTDLDLPRPRLLERIARPAGSAPDPDALEAALVDPVIAALAGFHGPAAELDPGLAKVGHKTEQSMVDAARRLVDRYRRTLARADETRLGRLDRLCARLRPDGAPQERVLGWAWVAARHGEGFVDAVLDATRPFHGALQELEP